MRVIADADGDIVRESDYYPFGGEREVEKPTVDDPHKFAGMYLDSESGLYYTHFRMYAPNLGRWLAPDPIAGDILNPQSVNGYAYVLNNPTTLMDPLGLQEHGPPDPEDIPGCGNPIYTNKVACVWEKYNWQIPGTSWNDIGCRAGSLSSCNVPAGYDIFDALAGAAGTYVTLDFRGNVGFGFDEGLWMQTWGFIDYMRSQGLTRVPTTGYFVYQDPNPIFQAPSRTLSENMTRTGFIPTLYSAIDSVGRSDGRMCGPYVTVTMQAAGVNMAIYRDERLFKQDPVLGLLELWIRIKMGSWLFP